MITAKPGFLQHTVLPPGGVFFISKLNNTLYTMSSVKGITYIDQSIDNGTLWTYVDPVSPSFCYDMEISGERIFLASVNGLWYRDLPAATSVENNQDSTL